MPDNKSRRGLFLKIASVVLVAQAVLFYSASHGESVPLASPLIAFPANFGEWRLYQEGVVEQETRDVLKADDLLTRTYVNPRGQGANLFMAFFKTQRTGQSPHSPKNCLPGSGWEPVAHEAQSVDVPVGDRSIHINRYLVSKGEDESLVLYWYQSHGRAIADEFSAKFYLIADSIRMHRSDTALVRVVVPVIHDNRPAAEQTALDFVKSAYPVVTNYLPR